MPTVRLSRAEAEGGYLPPICMCCGATPIAWETKNCSWLPSWVALFPILTAPISLLVVQRIQLRAPFCTRHYGFWTRRALAVGGGLVLIPLAIVGFFYLVEHSPPDRFNLLCLGLGGVVAAWAGVAIFTHVRGVHITEVASDAIVLDNVCEMFISELARVRVTGAQPPVATLATPSAAPSAAVAICGESDLVSPRPPETFPWGLAFLAVVVMALLVLVIVAIAAVVSRAGGTR